MADQAAPAVGDAFPALETAVARIGLAEAAATLADGWQESARTYPAHGLPFLERGFVADASATLAFPEEVREGLVGAARRISADSALSALAWHGVRRLYGPNAAPMAMQQWPSLVEALGAEGNLFYLLLAMANLPALREIYRRRRIPQQVAKATLADVRRWLEADRTQHGTWGLWPFSLPYVAYTLTGARYHLVRLQFQPGPFRSRVRVYRRRADGAVLALSEAGVRFRADGQLVGAGGLPPAESDWTADWEETERNVRGTPILPTGRALPETVALALDDWQLVLARGDPVLQIHIPAGEPMDFDRCGASFREAMRFFPRHCPDTPFRAFACSSWLLDNQFEHLLRPSANIVRFIRELYLLPGGSDNRVTLERVFGTVPADLRQAPRDTALRRAIVDHLLAGGHLRAGAAFLLPEDLCWGTGVYRRTPVI